MTLPGQLKEAAIIDGASQPQIFIRVYMPLTKAIVSTLFVFSFMGSWNDFLWPLITLQSAKLKTLPIGLASFQSLYGVQYNLLMAGAVLSVLPVMLAFLLAHSMLHLCGYDHEDGHGRMVMEERQRNILGERGYNR